LTELDPGDPISADGASFTQRNPSITDLYLRIGAVTHRHDAHSKLPDPVGVPSASVATSGGQIQAGISIFAEYTLTDLDGGETRASRAVQVNTEATPAAPSGGIDAVFASAAGTLPVGQYVYALSLNDAGGGETVLGPAVFVQRQPGYPSGQVDLSNLAQELGGFYVSWNLWRAQDGGNFEILGTGVTDTFTDSGLICTDAARTPPNDMSNVLSTNLLSITLPSGAQDSSISASAASISLYLSTDGSFPNPCLYAIYPVASAGATILIAQLTLLTGAPPVVSRSIQGAQKINPDTDMLDFPWKRPVASASMLPMTGNEDGDMRETLDTHILYIWDTGTSTWIETAQPGASGAAGPDGPTGASGAMGPAGPPVSVDGLGPFTDIEFVTGGDVAISVTDLGGGSGQVMLTASGGASGDVDSGGGASIFPSPETADYVLASGDRFKAVEMTTGGHVLVPLNADVAFVVGDWVELFADTTDNVDVLASGVVEVLAPSGWTSLAGENATARLRLRDIDSWVLSGRLAFTPSGGASGVSGPELLFAGIASAVTTGGIPGAMTLAYTVPAGAFISLVATNTDEVEELSGVTDSQGNTWHLDSSGLGVTVASCHVSAELVVGVDTITVAGAGLHWSVYASSFSDVGDLRVAGVVTNPSCSITPVAGDLVVGYNAGYENDSTSPWITLFTQTGTDSGAGGSYQIAAGGSVTYEGAPYTEPSVAVAYEPASVATFLYDTFTNVDGTPLTAHIGEVGAVWVMHPAGDVNPSIITTDELRRGDAHVAENRQFASWVPLSADYTVTAVLTGVGAANQGYMDIWARLDETANTGYLLRYNMNPGGGAPPEFELFRAVAGSFTELGTYTVSPPVTATLSVVGTTISVSIGGTVVMSYTDSGVSAIGRVGVGGGTGGGGDATNGVWLSSLLALPAAVFLKDAFVDADATDLSAHTSDSGSAWTYEGAEAGVLQILTDSLVGVVNGGDTQPTYYADVTPPSADYEVSAVVHNVNSTGVAIGLWARLDTTAHRGYLASIGGGVIGLYLHYTGGGSSYTLGGSASVAEGDTITLKVQGTTISVLVNGVTQITATDGTMTAAGKVGVRAVAYSGIAGTIDDLVATTV
jgi:hypothetical protein